MTPVPRLEVRRGAAAAPGHAPTPVAQEAAVVAALAAVTLAAAPGARGFLGSGAPLVPVLVAVGVMHATAWAARRLLPTVSLAAGLAACPLLVAWTAFPATTTLGLPLSGTWRAAGTAVRQALEALATDLPPAASEAAVVREGRLAVAVVFVALCALMADQAAFRLRRPLFALVPSLTLILLGGLRAPADRPGPAVAAWLGAAAAYLLLQHALDGGVGVGAPGAEPSSLRVAAVGAPAAVLAAVAVTAALVVAPLLPGYGSAPVVAEIAGRSRAGAARLQALVDLNPTLTQRSDEVMFTVSSPRAAYWRLTSLDVFDGRTWTQSDAEAEGGSASASPYVGGTPVLQRFRVEGLRSDWLPAAYRAQRLDAGDATFVAGDSSTLRGSSETRFGQSYEVVSYLPQLTAADLRRPARPVRADLRRYLALPEDLPRSVRDLARGAAGRRAESPFDAALSLQALLRTGFTYDDAVAPGAGIDALERFLFRTRRGYCEQFAGAFAVLARAVGLPARVAVGFTPGDPGPDGRFRVRGLHAHAWPEVFLEGAGWVAFEPTPGRGIPGAEAYTGVGAAQASSGGAEPAGGEPGVPATTASTLPPGPTSTAVATTTPAAGEPPPRAPSTTAAAPAHATPRPVGGRGVAPAAGAVVLAGAAVTLAGVPVAKRRRQAARRRRATQPGERVLVAWAEAAESLAAQGLARRPSETLLGHAARVSADDRLPAHLAGSVSVLAGRAGTASYGPGPVGEGDADEAVAAAEHIADGLRRAAPGPARVGRALDPRPLWRRPTP